MLLAPVCLPWGYMVYHSSMNTHFFNLYQTADFFIPSLCLCWVKSAILCNVHRGSPNGISSIIFKNSSSVILVLFPLGLFCFKASYPLLIVSLYPFSYGSWTTTKSPSYIV